jgi:hypothetical protein
MVERKDMTEQEKLIQEIRKRLTNTPKVGMIDSLAYVSALVGTIRSPVQEIRQIVIREANAVGVGHV